jgi:hypothetical protein
VRTKIQRGDGSRSYGEIHCKNSLLLPATDRPSRHPGAPFGHGNASARRQRSGHSRLAPPRPRMPWRTKAYSMMAPQGGLAPGAARGCRGWAETQSASSFSAVARQGAELGRLGQPTSPRVCRHASYRYHDGDASLSTIPRPTAPRLRLGARRFGKK